MITKFGGKWGKNLDQIAFRVPSDPHHYSLVVSSSDSYSHWPPNRKKKSFFLFVCEKSDWKSRRIILVLKALVVNKLPW